MLEIVKKVLKLLVILAAFRYGVFVFMAVSAFALGPLSVLINAWPNKKLLGYTIRMQFADVSPTIAICAVMAAVVLGVDRIFSTCFHAAQNSIPYLISALTCQAICGAMVFVALSCLIRPKPFVEYLKIIGPVVGKRSPRLATHLAGIAI